MPFRAKVRSVFGGKKSAGDLTTPVSDRSPRRTDIEYYKPGQLPPSKYPGHWNEKHQRKLHAFSFQAASRDRKGSIPSSHSPGGSIAQSRRSSWASRVRQSLGGRDDEDLNPARSKSHGSHVGQIVEGAEDEADVGNGKHRTCTMKAWANLGQWGSQDQPQLDNGIWNKRIS